MEIRDFTLALAAGLCLGAFFFGGLWWTTRRALASSHPAAWFMGSFVVRTGVTLGGFYLLGGGHWERLAACLLGFVMARMAATQLTKSCMTGGK
jgi:F1F0 ATPase subunit 2